MLRWSSRPPNGSRISCGDFLTAHCPTFLRSKASASCMRLLGSASSDNRYRPTGSAAPCAAHQASSFGESLGMLGFCAGSPIQVTEQETAYVGTQPSSSGLHSFTRAPGVIESPPNRRATTGVRGSYCSLQDIRRITPAAQLTFRHSSRDLLSRIFIRASPVPIHTRGCDRGNHALASCMRLLGGEPQTEPLLARRATHEELWRRHMGFRRSGRRGRSRHP